MKIIGKILQFLLTLAILAGLAYGAWLYREPILELVHQAEAYLPTQEGTQTVTTILMTKPAQTTAPAETTEETQSALQLPILDVIDEEVMPGAAGASLRAVQVAVKMLDWGVNTGLDTEEIRQATVAWLSNKGNDAQVEFAQKLEAVDDAYNQLRGENARELLDTAGCQDTEIFWGSDTVAPIEAIMDAAGLRG